LDFALLVPSVGFKASAAKARKVKLGSARYSLKGGETKKIKVPLSKRGKNLVRKRKTLPVETERHAFAYVFEGSGSFRSASQPFGVLTEKEVDGNEALVRESTGNRSLVLFDSGDEVTVQAGDEGIRFLLVSGKPIEEPVAWYGPIVMNTQAELQKAVSELRNGTFIKTG